MALLDSFQLGSGMNYPSSPSSLGTGMYYMNPADTPDPSLPQMPLGSGMYGIGSAEPAQASQQPNLLGLLGAGKSMMDASQPKMQTPQMRPYQAGNINFMPTSAITMPYTTGSQGVQSLLQQILQQSQTNPISR